MPKKLIKDEADAHQVLQFIYDEQDEDGLWGYIKDNLNIEIPREKICPKHDPPFKFIADVFFEKVSSVIAVANRNGGKTINFALLDVLNSYLHPGCETATVGAIEEQAKKCYRYFKSWVTNIPMFAAQIVSSLQSKTDWKNESLVEILTGTIRGVNSPHPHKAFLDEVELMAWNILQEAFSMAKSSDNIKGQTIITSTRKFAFGPMERLLAEAITRGFATYKWCIWETVEPYPIDDPELCKEINQMFPDMPVAVKAKIDGYYKWEDVIAKRKKIDDDIWESQWLCLKPSAKALVYPQFDATIHVTELPPDTGTTVELAEDFGFAAGHADVVGFWQVKPSGIKWCIDEIWVEGKTDDEIMDLMEDKLVELGFILPRYSAKKDRELHREQFNRVISAWYCPPEEPSKIVLRQRRGYRVITQNDPAIRKVVAGLPLIRKDLSDKTLFFDPKCKGTIGEMGMYPNKVRADGTILDEPDKKYDNGPDQVRYFYINRFPPTTGGSLTEATKNIKSRPVTSGIRDTVF